MDNRTKETVNQFLSTSSDKHLNQLTNLCGLPISPYFSALKYRWLIDNVTQVRDAIEEKRCLFGTVDSWLIWVGMPGDLSLLYSIIEFNSG